MCCHFPFNGLFSLENIVPFRELVRLAICPAVFLSPSAYNGKAGLAILCQITSQVKNYPFEVIIPDGLKIGGAISSDQVKVWIGKSGRQGLFARYPHQR